MIADVIALYAITDGSKFNEVGLRYYTFPFERELRDGEIIIDSGTDIEHMKNCLEEMSKDKVYKRAQIVPLSLYRG